MSSDHQFMLRGFDLGDVSAAQMGSSSAFKSLSSSAESTTEISFTAPYNPLCVLAQGTCLIRRWLIMSD